jgi:Arc/MetJ family transcription regulator
VETEGVIIAVTSIDIDQDKLRQAKELAGTTSNRETVDLALRTLIAVRRQPAAVERIIGRRFVPEQIDAPSVAPAPAALLPADSFSGAGVLLVLDIDGVLNTINVDEWERNRIAGQAFENAMPPVAEGFERRRVRTAHGAKYWVDINPQVIDALDVFISNSSNNIELGWLTTWGPNVRAFVEQALDGRLAGGFVLAKPPPRYRGAVPATWKTAALRARITTTGQPWIWADDEEIAMARTLQGFDDDPIFAVPHVIFEPVPTVGLTLDDVAAMTRFAATMRAAQTDL